MSDTAKRAMDLNLSKHNISIRSVKKAIALAKSIACLEQQEIIKEEMILESFSYTRPLIYEGHSNR
jgi:predicted ATPase with chaperone activity